jgi:multicomponent Na+:H+ antiporter subunit B
MPLVGEASNPVHTRAAAHYVSAASLEATHAPNLVTTVLASYRGFDTLFETAVIFTAGMTLVLLLRRKRGEAASDGGGDPRTTRGAPMPALQPAPANGDAPNTSARLVRPPTPSGRHPRPEDDDVLEVLAKVLIPFVIVFGVYVVTHGELGPGGGFQGGVIVAAAYLLTALVFGMQRARALMPQKVSDALAGVGVLIYAGVGVATMALGGLYLDYDVLASGYYGQMVGMTLVELGVGVTVAAVMVTVFNEMVDE